MAVTVFPLFCFKVAEIYLINGLRCSPNYVETGNNIQNNPFNSFPVNREQKSVSQTKCFIHLHR